MNSGSSEVEDELELPTREVLDLGAAAEQVRIPQSDLKVVNALLKLVQFPVMYWVLALVGVALASLQEHIGLMTAAIVAAVTFMVRQWSGSNLPQRNTFLTHAHAYLCAAVALMTWGVYWRLFQFWALLLVIPAIALIRVVQRASTLYSLEGAIPESLSRYWSRNVARADHEQASRFAVSGAPDLSRPAVPEAAFPANGETDG